MSKLAIAFLTATLTCAPTVGALAAEPSPAASPAKPESSGLTKTASGLQYSDTKVGTGAAAKAGDTVSIAYSISINDKKIEEVRALSPMEFAIGKGQGLKGLDEGIHGMKAGGQRQLIVPPSLGYGGEQAGKVPPNSTMVIDVELLAIK